MFEGVTVALVTPFRDGNVDFAKVKELVAWHIEQGTDVVLPCGTTGESPTLSHEEHEKVITATIEAARGKVKVMAGTGSNSTAEALRLTKHAAKAGADGALLVVPYYNKPTQEGLYRHFKAVADAVDIPIIIYNIPGRTGVNMATETICRLAEVRNIVGVKEATGDINNSSAILGDPKGARLTVLSGDDSLTLPIMSVGGKGIISVVANVVPRDVKAMVAAFNSGDVKKAVQLHTKLFALCRAMFIETNPIPIKTAMKKLGMITGEMRLPLCEMASANEARLDKAMREYGLLK
jgi:4-hydroxy-tetrahydrodipicolinate synthase